MKCPTIRDLPPPPDGRSGWPWTEQSRGAGPETGGDATPRISITTPSYNQAAFLEETIRSVLLQGYPDLEYFVMDGGSSDGSLEIIRKYQPWLAGWASEPDGGQSAAINKGWSQSSGDLIAWLNSDDVYEPDAFHSITRYMTENPAVDLAYGDCKIVDEQGRLIEMAPARTFDIAPLLADDWIIAQPSAFLRRSTYDDLGGVNESLNFVMDWEYWLRIAAAGRRIDYAPMTLAMFRTWPGAKSSTQKSQWVAEKVGVLDRIFDQTNDMPGMRRLRRSSNNFFHLRTAKEFFKEGQLSEARHHYALAIKSQPLSASNLVHLRKMAMSILHHPRHKQGS